MNRRDILLELLLSLALLFGVGMAAIGASGALAAGFSSAFGKSFVSGDQSGVTYTAERCEYLQQDQPQAPTCEAAATAHHFEEVVSYRLAAGVLGLFTLGGWFVVRRRRLQLRRTDHLPAGFIATAGASTFGLAAAGLLAGSVPAITSDQATGAGAYLSAGIVSLVVFLAFAIPLLKTIYRQPPQGPMHTGATLTNAE